MTAKIVDGKKIAEDIQHNVSENISDLVDKNGLIPNVGTIIIGDDPSSRLYMKLRNKACKKVGINTFSKEFPKDVSEKKLISEIKKLNTNSDVHGILIQLPLPDHLNQSRIIENINPTKDVEGFHPYNMGRTLLGDEHIVPCTPLSVITILDYEKVDLKGLDITIINHSNVVGKPLSVMFLNRNATVNVCHVFSKDTKKYSKQSDILVSATGIPGFVKSDMVKKNCFVIDVGIIKTDEGITGDVDLEDVKEITSRITPVPGGVGPVTVACSLINMVKTYGNSIK